MKLEDFVKNLRGIDDRHDVDHEMLVGIYERIRKDEFKTGPDHVSQVIKVQKTIEKNCPDLALPHRRLVCYCRLYEVNDPNKKERQGRSSESMPTTPKCLGGIKNKKWSKMNLEIDGIFAGILQYLQLDSPELTYLYRNHYRKVGKKH